MCHNITKTILLGESKRYNSKYNIKRIQIFDVVNVDALKTDITYLIEEIESNKITATISKSPPSTITTTTTTNEQIYTPQMMYNPQQDIQSSINILSSQQSINILQPMHYEQEGYNFPNLSPQQEAAILKNLNEDMDTTTTP